MERKKLTYGKEERLKSRKKIDFLFRQGQTFLVPPYKVYFLLEPGHSESSSTYPHLQMGIGAGKKHFKTAVKRNRIKRMSREAFRVQKQQLMDLLRNRDRSLGVFLVYTGSILVDFSLVQTSIAKIIGKLLQYADEQA